MRHLFEWVSYTIIRYYCTTWKLCKHEWKLRMYIVNIVIIWHEKDHENSCDFPRVSLEIYALFIWSRNIYKRYISNIYCICRNFTYILESHNTANVYMELQVLYREIRLQGFLIYRDLSCVILLVIVRVILYKIHRDCT